MEDFEVQLNKLRPKLLDRGYAQRAYASLCNIEWLSTEAPSDWYDYLQQQELDWNRRNNVFWRKWPRCIIDKIRDLVIKLAYRTEVNENSIKISKAIEPWNWLNIRLMNMAFWFWVYPPLSPNWIYSCSWRYAGGMIADIRAEGENYMDFYCSGNEGNVDGEFELDMEQLGWKPIVNENL